MAFGLGRDHAAAGYTRRHVDAELANRLVAGRLRGLLGLAMGRGEVPAMTKKERLYKKQMDLYEKWRKSRSARDWRRYRDAKQEYDDCEE
jgi:hypothetical protein